MSESTFRPRYLNDRAFPSYAYLPGRFPHPVRDPGGHSFGLEEPNITPGDLLGSQEYLWGTDLFNHGYYWEAHEAWEGLWQAAEGDQRLFLKGMILLSASGVKVREGKRRSALRHASRAAEVFLPLPTTTQLDLARYIGMTPFDAARRAIAAIQHPLSSADQGLVARPTFPFMLHCTSHGLIK